MRIVLVLFFLFASISPAIAQEDLAEGQTLTSTVPHILAVYETVLKSAGNPDQIISVEITAEKMAVTVQAGNDPQALDRWQITYKDRLFSSSRKPVLSGPEPIRPSGPVTNLRDAYLSPADIRLDLLEDIMEAAQRYTAITDQTAALTRIHIGRHVTVMPNPAFGDPRWTLEFKGQREHASVFLNAAGRIIGGNLRGTNRVRTMDARRDQLGLATNRSRVSTASR